MPCSTFSSLASSTRSSAYFTVRINDEDDDDDNNNNNNNNNNNKCDCYANAWAFKIDIFEEWVSMQ
jgi:hypothetical protein